MAETHIERLPWHDLSPASLTSDLVLVPVGALEPHGRHAPLGTDVFIAAGLADRLASATGGYVYPAMSLATLNLIYDFRYAPGSMSFSHDLLIRIYTEIGCELVRQGFRRVVYVNAHSCNAAILQIAAFEVHSRSGGQAGVLEWWSAGREVIEAIKGHAWGTHGDEIETSLLLATEHGHLVDLGQAVANSKGLDDVDADERALYQQKVVFTRRLDERWVGQSLNMGDPRLATAEHGNAILERCVEVGLKLTQVLALQAELEARARV
jgi:creatinine amidohydrolase